MRWRTKYVFSWDEKHSCAQLQVLWFTAGRLITRERIDPRSCLRHFRQICRWSRCTQQRQTLQPALKEFCKPIVYLSFTILSSLRWEVVQTRGRPQEGQNRLLPAQSWGKFLSPLHQPWKWSSHTLIMAVWSRRVLFRIPNFMLVYSIRISIVQSGRIWVRP